MSKKKQEKDDQVEELHMEEHGDVMSDLDPHLQEIVLSSRDKEALNPSIAGQELEGGPMVVDVIARLDDPDLSVPGLDVVRKIGQIITGTVEVDKIEEVRKHSNVLSLKRATELHTDVRFSLGEIRSAGAQLRDGLPQGARNIDGAGVVVGIVDYGCDFVHNNFRKEDGTTRLLYLWDQSGGQSTISPDGFGYGREFDASAINQALEAPSPYQALSYDPDSAAHGTHVMDIAAGNGRATGWPGVAPGADLIFVEVAAWDYGAEESFGNSRRLLDAVDYIFSKAQALGKAAVVNLSLGTHGGPHDGSTLVEQGLDGLLDTPGRAIVISAGNSWLRASHASGDLAPGESRALTWQISPGDVTDNELEVWYDGQAELEMTLISPTGQQLGPVPLERTISLRSSGGARLGQLIHRHNDPNNHDNHINLLLNRSLVGDWQVRLDNVGEEDVTFHAWIERDDRGQSRFATQDEDRTHTVGSISCGQRTVVVGSYDARVPGRPLSSFTSEGPTRDGRAKPEISAPGQSVVAARSLSQGAIAKSGTSMAAPHVTGVLALLMQAACRQVASDEVRALLAGSRRRNPPAGEEWHSRYGEGCVDCLALLLTQFAPVGPPEPAERPAPLVAPPTPAALPARIAATSSGMPAPSASEEGATLITAALLAQLSHAATSSHSRIRVQVEVEPMEGKRQM
ncbi:MAG: S8 family peptidase [Chloroflexota bacterium]